MTDKPTLPERYRSAVNTSHLRSDPDTTRSDSDVLGAYALADLHLSRGSDGQGNHYPPAPLAVALERLFGGDSRAMGAIVRIMSENVWRRSRRDNIRMNHAQATRAAQMVIAWYRDSTCKPCNGRAYETILGSPTLSTRECPHCRGTGKRPLISEFAPVHQDLVSWLASELEREMGKAAPVAMALIAPRFDL